MKPTLYRLFAVLLVLSFVLAACATPTAAPTEAATTAATTEAATTAAPAEKTVLKVWSFTNEINTMAIAFEGKHPDVDVQYTMIPMTNGEYQTKVKAALGTEDVPDVIALEASFVRQYVEAGDILADLNDLLPETQTLKTYQAVVDVGTYDGVTKAYSYQATPGAVFYRRSLAKEYFGTDDPAQIQAMMADMDKFTEMAKTIKDKSAGKDFMVASSAEFQNAYYANRAQPWIVDNTLVVDPMVEKYVEIAKTYRDSGYEAQAGQWAEGWFAGMNDSLVGADGTPHKIFCYFLPTWGLPYVLAPNAKSADGTKDTSGDWGVVSGPLPYQWGGTWVGVMQGAKQEALAKEFVKFVALDEENLTNWATGVYTNDYLKAIDPNVAPDQKQAAGDFVSSQVVVEKITASFDNSDLSKFLGGQNSYGGFAAAAPSVSGKLMTGSDDAIQRALGDPLNQYLDGKVSLDDMWKLWKDAVRNEFPDLTIN